MHDRNTFNNLLHLENQVKVDILGFVDLRDRVVELGERVLVDILQIVLQVGFALTELLDELVELILLPLKSDDIVLKSHVQEYVKKLKISGVLEEIVAELRGAQLLHRRRRSDRLRGPGRLGLGLLLQKRAPPTRRVREFPRPLPRTDLLL